MGWPFTVLELKRWGWDWDDPALDGPAHSPPLQLVAKGLILNPIIIGAGSYILIVTVFVAFTIGRRFERQRRGVCPFCRQALTKAETKVLCVQCSSVGGHASGCKSTSRWRQLAHQLVWCILLTTALNVPFAITRLETITYAPTKAGIAIEGDELPSVWPARTPHAEPWPTPTSWKEWHGFGQDRVTVNSRNKANLRDSYLMKVQRVGWPFRIFEQKVMRWNSRDPSLEGPDDHPGMRVLHQGAVLNVIAISGGMIVLLAASSLLFRAFTSRFRAQPESVRDNESEASS